MNRTNRALNRIILFIVGLVLFVVGLALGAIIVWPAAKNLWVGGTKSGRSWLDQAVHDTLIGATTVSWIAVAALALLLLLLILLIRAITRIGGGRTREVLRAVGSQSPLGRVTVEEAFASDALKHSLSRRDEFLSSSVTANEIHQTAVMHVSVTPRQNTSPLSAVASIDQLVTTLAALTGTVTPTYISLHSGLRAKLARDQQRLS